MGSGSFTARDWDGYSKVHIAGKAASAIYASHECNDDHNPAKISLRESRDNSDHPTSTPIILALDVTGSMSRILESTAEGLGELVLSILDRKPVSDPQVMFAAIGDSTCDTSPLQVTQFESDIRIASQLKELYFEQGGGGNRFESYPLMWQFAKDKIATDAWDKRRKKGFIFTLGDDGYPDYLTKEELNQFLDMVGKHRLIPSHNTFPVLHRSLDNGIGIFSSTDEFHNQIDLGIINDILSLCSKIQIRQTPRFVRVLDANLFYPCVNRFTVFKHIPQALSDGSETEQSNH